MLHSKIAFTPFQIGHIQYLSTLIKDDRKFFRKKFGIQFFLDVIRIHYVSCPAMTKDDCKTIRSSLFGLIKFYLQKDVGSKDALPIVNFILSVKQEGLLLIVGSNTSQGVRSRDFITLH
jgi:hypothetical protein